MDKIRDLMLRIEAENGARIDCERNDADSYHVQLLKDAGFIHSRMKEFPNVFYGGMEAWMEMRLTWEGTKFLDDVRKDATWWNVKELLFRKGRRSPFIPSRPLPLPCYRMHSSSRPTNPDLGGASPRSGASHQSKPSIWPAERGPVAWLAEGMLPGMLDPTC